MEFVGIIFLIWIVVSVLRRIGNAIGGGSASGTRQVSAERSPDQKLLVRIKPETVDIEGSSFDVWRVETSGAVEVPRNNYKAKLHVWLSDITDGDTDPSPVLCMIPDVADEHGCFSLEYDFDIPYTVSTFDDMPVCSIPSFALVCPKRGNRRLRVVVKITDRNNEDILFNGGIGTIRHVETNVGYLEREQHSRDMDKLMSEMAVAVALTDGQFDKSEARVIRSFFLSRYRGRDDEAERKQDISKVMTSTPKRLKASPTEVASTIERVVQRIRDEGDNGLKRESYELCLQVVGADGQVTAHEIDSVRYIARQLELDEEVVKEVNDRHLKISQISGATVDPLDMPLNLSRAEQLKWLAREYKRWQPRQNHSDPEIRQEATDRIELIAERRRETRNAAN